MYTRQQFEEMRINSAKEMSQNNSLKKNASISALDVF